VPSPSPRAMVSPVMVSALVLVVAAACSAESVTRSGIDHSQVTDQGWSQVQPLADPKSYLGPSTAYLPIENIAPVVEHARPVLPATVTDDQGTTVTVRSTDRILALDLYGSLAATVYGLGLGDHLVGRDQSSGFPAAQHLPLVTSGAHVLSAEAILARRPTVIITDTTLGPWAVIMQMRGAGIPVVIVSSKRSMSTVDPLIEQVATALGVRAPGDKLRTRLRNDVAAVARQVSRVAPRDPARRLRMIFLYVRGQAGVYYLFGKGSGADSLIGAVDGIDVATQAGIEGFAPLNAEALAKSAPDVIVMMTAGLASVGGVNGALKLPGIAQTPAGQHRRIVDMSDSAILSFGPRTADVVDALARALYAPTSVAATGRTP
jgi:iron complex transport system substrate-binding protein